MKGRPKGSRNKTTLIKERKEEITKENHRDLYICEWCTINIKGGFVEKIKIPKNKTKIGEDIEWNT